MDKILRFFFFFSLEIDSEKLITSNFLAKKWNPAPLEREGSSQGTG